MVRVARRVLWGALVVVVAGTAVMIRDVGAEGSPPGTIAFAASNLLAKADGSFESWRFTRVDGDPAHPEDGIVEVEVDVASIDTGNRRRDDHLRSGDFFDVARFPTADVRLYGLEPKGEDDDGRPRYGVTLDIRIRDVEKTMGAEFTLVRAVPPTVEGTLMLDRVEFGIGGPHRGWNPLSVREDVEVRFRAELPGLDAPARD